MCDDPQLHKGVDVAHAAPEAAEYTPTLPDVLQQLELPAVEALADVLACVRCVGALRLTCWALRDLADASVRIPKMLTLQLRADGAVTEPLSALERWGRRGGISLLLQLPAEAAAGANALLLAAFTQLPEEARRRVTAICLNVEEHSAASEDSDSDGIEAPAPTISGAAVGALAASLPGLRKLDLSDLPSKWTPGDAGEAYTALAALGTLEELELPGVPSLTGVKALAGSLRRLAVIDNSWRGPDVTLSRSAVTTLGQLTRLEELKLEVSDIELGEGPRLQGLIRQLPSSLRTLDWNYSPGRNNPDGIFGLLRGRVTSLECDTLRPISALALATLVREEVLPCLQLSGRLERLRVRVLQLDAWADPSLDPLLELWRRSGGCYVNRLLVDERRSAADVCSALAALEPVEELQLQCASFSFGITLSQQPPPLPSASGPLPDLPPPEEVLRMALQRITPPGAGKKSGAGASGLAAGAGLARGVVLLRGPAAAAALEQPGDEAVRAWAQGLERRARATAGTVLEAYGRIILEVLPLPPASAVLLHLNNLQGAATARAVIAAVAAAGDGSEVTPVQASHLFYSLERGLAGALGEVMTQLWAASCAGEEGPSLQQRVEWALAVRAFLKGLPGSEAPWGWRA